MSEGSSSKVVNIKKRSASDIFWGEDITTGQMHHISDVRRGLHCDCVCALCKRPLIARQGLKRRPHFAHKTNNDCIYSNEVAVYKVVAEILGESMNIMLPQAALSFPAWKENEILQKQRVLPLDGSPEYHCGESQYPPDLIVTIQKRALRIILDFGRYYDEHDITLLRESEKKQGHACVRYRFPVCDDEDFFSREHLKSVLQQGKGIVWVYSPLESKWRQRYLAKAQRLQPYKGRIDCPLHKEKVQERYSVPLSTCLQCRFNVSEGNSCLCLGGGGYEHRQDFEADESTRLEKVERIRAENEKKIEEQARILAEQELQRKQREAEIERQRQQRAAELERQRQQIQAELAKRRQEEQAARERAQKIAQEEREAEYQRICASFDEYSENPTFDKDGNRYIKCKMCGKIKPTSEMSEYGGKGGANLGRCSVCIRTLT